ncbi:hypothetical protein HZ326_8156 [Fusarium oxysporum f. sp. albedinis]|nr:hypothetical protein HZ326_8156 [Fusarium oxysporum f. sp. albedinis]
MRTLDGWKIPSNNPMTANQAFLLATRNGGLALRRGDLVAAIILHSNVGDAMDVMVDGEWRKRDGKLVVSHDRVEVEERFLQSAKRIQKIWEYAAVPTLEGEYMAGAHYAPTEFQSAVRGSR